MSDDLLHDLVYSMLKSPILIQLSSVAWESVRAVLRTATASDTCTTEHVCTAAMAYWLERRSLGDYRAFAQPLGLMQHVDHDLWPPPGPVVSTVITCAHTPLTEVFTRNAVMALRRVVQEHQLKQRGRPIHPASRILEGALHYDGTGFVRWMRDRSIMEWALTDVASDPIWYERDRSNLADDIAYLKGLDP